MTAAKTSGQYSGACTRRLQHGGEETREAGEAREVQEAVEEEDGALYQGCDFTCSSLAKVVPR